MPIDHADLVPDTLKGPADILTAIWWHDLHKSCYLLGLLRGLSAHGEDQQPEA
eukprot:CAMPEP_0170629644 /NCGR_PEP_ID=MMETSP0224-20130122/33477_1 /TAXON_ID=285029 /ORGANISM="Togula jolla, Strain CCCM 725" /LENGTH=52 /DNA_ID=CAMNT_0010957449 /DNA_START=95 /DNA_END=253 /DNA_ORIENTATION=-